MKPIFILFSIFFTTTFAYSQANSVLLSKIDTYVADLNKITEFEIVKLENSDFIDTAFLNQQSVGYGFLFGYFVNEKLIKIREVIGIKLLDQIAITEYYFDDSELIFVFESEKSGKNVFISADGTIDHKIDKPNFSVKYHFNNLKLIKKSEDGMRETILLPNEEYFDSQSKEGQLLDSADEYKSLILDKYQK